MLSTSGPWSVDLLDWLIELNVHSLLPVLATGSCRFILVYGGLLYTTFKHFVKS